MDQAKRSDLPNFSAPNLPGGPYAVTREFFLRGLSACYFVAFASFLVQVPGLYGPQGLLPAQEPSLLEHRCLWGMGLGVLGLSGLACTPVMLGMLQLYAALVHGAPAPFYNFQWDILLLEVGFLGVLLAPLLHSSLEPRPSRATLWLLRFVLFKLMLMSGVVKITEGDDSWKQLTAIWYHFATQCIPTPLAWFFHNLPLPLEKLFCALCFVIEIPAAFLILVPVWHVQVLAALLQIALQIVIILTGNYTFFNYLTILMACTLLDRDTVPRCCLAEEAVTLGRSAKCDGDPGHWEAAEAVADTTPLLGVPAAGPGAPLGVEGNAARSAATTLSAVVRAVSADGSAERALQRKAFASVGLPLQPSLSALRWVGLAFCTVAVLLFSTHLGLNQTLALQITSQELLEWTSRWVPRVLVFLSAVIPLATLLDIVDAVCVDGVQLQGLGRPGRAVLGAAAVALLLFRGVLCQHWLALAPGPLAEVAPSLDKPTTRVSLWRAGLPSSESEVMPFGLPNYGPYPYGLFRAMTGIGPNGQVARPEIVLEVQEVASGTWRELQFPCKPGDVHRRPPLVAPYQPRLDWQMWFQALSPFPEVWFSRLLTLVLEGSPAVLSLLDTGNLPDIEVSAIRAVAYEYNFTSYGQSGWWRRQLVDGHFSGPQQAPRPLNLARAASERPIDWRPLAVWCLLAVVALRWLVPLGVRWGFAFWESRGWRPVSAADAERKED